MADINALQMGAANDATADVTAHFAAMQAASTRLRRVVPKGIYIISDLLLSTADQVWEFDENAVLLHKSAASASCIRVTGQGIRLRGLRGDGNKDNIASSVNFISVQGAHGLELEYFDIRNVKSQGIYAFDSDYLRISKGEIHDSGSNAVHVFVSSREEPLVGLDISDLYVDRRGVNSSGSEDGIRIAGKLFGSTPVTVNRPSLTRVKARLPVDSLDTASEAIALVRAEDATLTAVATEGGRIGISLPRCHRARLVGIDIDGAMNYGIEIASATDVSVSDFTIDGRDSTVGLNRGVASNVISTETPSNNLTLIGGRMRRCIAGFYGGGLSDNKLRNLSIIGCNFGEFKDANRVAVTVTHADGLNLSANVFDGLRTDGSGLKAYAPLTLTNVSNVSFGGGIAKDCQNIIRLSANNSYDKIDIHDVLVPGTSIVPVVGTNTTLGTISMRDCLGAERNGYRISVLDYVHDVINAIGTGSPEGGLVAGIGSRCTATDGTEGAIVFLKTADAGQATGWTAIG